MEVCNDEAYHYLFSVYPDWSFFDHPPITMWLEWLGIRLCGGWVHPFSLRLAFVFLMAGSTWLMARLAARWYGEWAGFYAALLLNLTIYYGGAGGFALPDGPLLFFGLLTVTALGNAMIDKPRRILPWVWVGLAFAGTLLSKYHAIFLPIGAVLYIALTPRARPLLWRPGPYVALAIGALGFVPVLIWNAQNDWLSFAFQGRRAVGIEFNIAGVLTTLLGPIVYLFPWTWLLLMGMLLQRLWRWRTIQEIDRLLVCLALVPILFFLAVSFVRPVLPHWSLLGFVILFPFAGAKCAEWSSVNPSRVRRRIAGIAAAVLLIAGLALVQARFGVVSFPSKDPLIEASGWSSVPAELKARGLIGAPKTFLFTDRWYDSGQLAFAVRNEVPVLCYNSGDAHGFAQWSNPNDWIGWDGVLITTRDCPEQIRGVREYFEKVELATEFPMTRGGTPFRQVRVWRCTRQERPFPFRYGMN
jgi:4-amino-4-deoxy-L-arabinose transferase-like glycosyltransferase